MLLSSPSKVPGRRNLLAFEVDLASEATQVFGKKLEAASRVLTTWANGGAAAVVISGSSAWEPLVYRAMRPTIWPLVIRPAMHSSRKPS